MDIGQSFAMIKEYHTAATNHGPNYMSIFPLSRLPAPDTHLISGAAVDPKTAAAEAHRIVYDAYTYLAFPLGAKHTTHTHKLDNHPKSNIIPNQNKLGSPGPNQG